MKKYSHFKSTTNLLVNTKSSPVPNSNEEENGYDSGKSSPLTESDFANENNKQKHIINDCECELTQLKIQNTLLQKSLKTKTLENARNKSNFEQLTEFCQCLVQEKETYETKCYALESTETELNNKLKESKDKVALLGTALQFMKKQNDDNDGLHDSKSTLRLKMEQYIQENNKLQTDNDGYVQKINVISDKYTKYHELEIDHTKLQNQHSSLKQHYQSLKQQFQACQSTYKDLHCIHLDNLKQMEILENNSETLRDQLNRRAVHLRNGDNDVESDIKMALSEPQSMHLKRTTSIFSSDGNLGLILPNDVDELDTPRFLDTYNNNNNNNDDIKNDDVYARTPKHSIAKHQQDQLSIQSPFLAGLSELKESMEDILKFELVDITKQITAELKKKTIDFEVEYTEIRKIGSGSFGQVIAAKSNISQTIVAIKQLSVDNDHDGSKMREIQKEIDILESSNEEKCQYIVSYIGSQYMISDKEVWIAMEYCAGGTVQDMIHYHKRGICEPEIAKCMQNVLSGVHYLHATCNIIHRDIKPENILIDNHGIYKISDFGTSKTLVGTDLTQTVRKGTSFYMAPEVAKTKNMNGYDNKVDIWSIGLTVYHMRVGKVPVSYTNKHRDWMFEPWLRGDTNFEFMAPRLELKKGYSDDICDFVVKCLQIDPNARLTAKGLLEHAFVKNDIVNDFM